MKILFDTNFDSKLTRQEAFPKTLICDCDNSMYPIVQIVPIADDEGMIVQRRLIEVKHGIYDSAIIAIYQCDNCMELTALYNQA